MSGEDLALAGWRFHDERTGDVLADIEIARTVVGHAVALVARIAHLDDARAPSAADIARHVAEIEALLCVPDRALAETEPGADLLDRRVAIDQTQQFLVGDFDGVRGLSISTLSLAVR